MNRLPLFLAALFTLVAFKGCVAPRPELTEQAEVGTELSAAANAFYADHGRWPRDIEELEGFDASRLRDVRFHKRPIYGGLEIRYTTRSAHGGDPEGRLYLPPPRSWSPKGARTQPATAPAETQPVR